MPPPIRWKELLHNEIRVTCPLLDSQARATNRVHRNEGTQCVSDDILSKGVEMPATQARVASVDGSNESMTQALESQLIGTIAGIQSHPVSHGTSIGQQKPDTYYFPLTRLDFSSFLEQVHLPTHEEELLDFVKMNEVNNTNAIAHEVIAVHMALGNPLHETLL
ncbi:hypothetical protein PR048_010992 [Dryococelus australis]|uniref:Uncharacterized protein n=1 Tax=Dryococelus australis TaxID=614101 RepID=A0ABQ9HL13_9NEOP|nr:hypothetical protein PR048_010992 [Dryococelus australis]